MSDNQIVLASQDQDGAWRVVQALLSLLIVVFLVTLGGGAPLYVALIAILIPIYIFPTIVASYRRHRQRYAIIALNILLGWSFIGWAAALVWSFTAPPPPPTLILREIERPGSR